MSVHKCNKCFHQAYAKPDTGKDLEHCLLFDKRINRRVKACSEYTDIMSMKEPVCFLELLETLIKNPNATEKRKIKKIKMKVEELRAWGKQANKPRIVKTDKK